MSESYQSPTTTVQWPVMPGPLFVQASSIQHLQELCRFGLSMPRSDLKASSKRLEEAAIRTTARPTGIPGSPSFSFPSCQGQGHEHNRCYVWRYPFGAGDIHAPSPAKPALGMSLRRLTVRPSSRPLAAALRSLAASHTLPFDHAQVWSYCIISLSLQYHPPVLHDGSLVRACTSNFAHTTKFVEEGPPSHHVLVPSSRPTTTLF